MLKAISIFILSCCLIACSSTKSDSQAPTLNYIDLTGDKIIEAGDEYWTVVKRSVPRYPREAAIQGLNGCVNIIIGINADGKMQGYKIQSSYPKRVFDNVAAAALAQWQWKATKKNISLQPILTSIRLDFSVDGSSYNAKYEKNCPSSV